MNSSRETRNFVATACLSGIFYVAGLGSAYAYVDPGSGSVIVTTILGLIAAVGYTFRKAFYKFKRKLTGSSIDSEDKK